MVYNDIYNIEGCDADEKYTKRTLSKVIIYI